MTEVSVPVGKLKEKKMKKHNFLASLKSLKKGVGSINQGTDPGIRICTKMSRSPTLVNIK
jgi:hypothetical protein